MFASGAKTGGYAAACASLDGRSASGFAHLPSGERNPVTHFGVQPSADKSTPSSGDVTNQQWLVACETGITPWSFAAMNPAWIALSDRCDHSFALRKTWGPCGACCVLHSD